MPATRREIKRREAVSISVRVAAAVAGSYALTYLSAAVLTSGFARLAMGSADAVMLGSVTALLAFPAVSIWAFAERRLWLVVAGPTTAAAVLGLLATWLRP